MPLLSTSNPKTAKGEPLGYRTHILHLAPHKLSGYNTCPSATPECSAYCLNTAGRGQFTSIQAARIRKTRWFFEHRQSFLTQLVKEILLAIESADRAGLIPCFRLNGTSDIRWELIKIDVQFRHRRQLIRLQANSIMELFSDIQFYDYTKIPNRRVPENYHLTFSQSTPSTPIPSFPTNLAVVFSGSLPATYRGRRVIDGTTHDLRFLDPAGCIVGLLPKGRAKKAPASSPFIILAASASAEASA